MSRATSVCILNYGSGNIGSVHNMIRSLGVDVRVSNASKDIEAASHLVLPGVGTFNRSLLKVRQSLPLQTIDEMVIQGKTPLLGICVGMQILATRGEEGGTNPGLGWIAGNVRRLSCPGARLPHVGWNTVQFAPTSFFHETFDQDDDFYFVHSYALDESPDASASTTYVDEFVCAVEKENIFGVQFHPEKSQNPGRRLMSRFIEYHA